MSYRNTFVTSLFYNAAEMPKVAGVLREYVGEVQVLGAYIHGWNKEGTIGGLRATSEYLPELFDKAGVGESFCIAFAGECEEDRFVFSYSPNEGIDTPR